MGLFDTNSTTRNDTQNFDQRVGASENGVAQRIENAQGGTVNISSDAVAQLAITGAQAQLEKSQDFLSGILSDLFKSVDSRAASAEQNVTAAQDLAAEVVGKSQQGATDQLVNLLWIVGGIGIALYALNQGYFK